MLNPDVKNSLVETHVNIKVPVVDSDTVYVVGYGISFNNTGETTAIIDDLKRIAPGSTWSIGHGPLNAVLAQTFRVRFVGVGENYLEIEEHQLKGCDYSNYERQGI